MADPVVSPVVIGLAVTAAAGSLAAGYAGFKSAQVQRQQYEEERKTAQLQGEQEEVMRLQRLRGALATQNALRATRGLSLTSPQAGVIRQRTIAEADSDILNIRLNAAGSARRLGLGATQASIDGYGSLIGGAANAAGGLISVARARQETGRTDDG